MRRIYIVAKTYEIADAAVRLLNGHSKRNQMELIPVTRPEGLRGIPRESYALLVETGRAWPGRVQLEEALRWRAARWVEMNPDGGYVLGELL